MERLIFSVCCTLLTAGFHYSSAIPVPTGPVIPRGAFKPQAKPDESTEADDPAKIADRVAENTKKAADLLKDQDAGDETRAIQEKTLKDIDALLNPPKKNNNNSNSGSRSSGNSSNQGESGQSQSPSQGQAGSSPKSSNGSKEQEPQKNSSSGQKNEPKPPGQQGDKPKPKSDNTPNPQGQHKETKSGQQPGSEGEPKQSESKADSTKREHAKSRRERRSESDLAKRPVAPAPRAAGDKPSEKASSAGGGGETKTTLAPPMEDAMTKQVWGHLPEKLRDRMTQYYKEKFMPKYDELLKQYYTDLAERENASKK